MALKVLRYSNIAEYRQIIRRSLCGQESDLAAVSHETSQKLTTTTIDTRGAAVATINMAPGWDKSSSGIGYTGIIKLQQTLLDKILSMYIRLFCNYSLRASTFLSLIHI